MLLSAGWLFLGPGGEAFADVSTTTVSCATNPVFINQTTLCTATVTGTGTPAGTVNFSDAGKAGAFDSSSCTLSGGSCSVNYTPAAGDAGATTITGNYAGSTPNDPSSDDFALTVNLRTTSTAITCSPTSVVVNDSISCTVTVTDTAAGGTASAPGGTIAIGQTAGTGTATACALSGGTCTFNYTPTNTASPRNVTASYTATDSVHSNSGPANSESITVTNRLTETNLQCSDTPLVVNEPAQCAVSVVDISAGNKSVPTGTVTFSTSVAGSEGSFSPTTCTLDGGGFCTVEVVYTAANADTATHTLTASYGGDSTHEASDDTFAQAIEKREMELLLNCPQVELFVLEPMTCTVTISDDSTAGSPPSAFPGTLSIDNTVDGDDNEISSNNCNTIPSPPSGSCTFVYTPQAGDAGLINIRASYTPPGSGVVYNVPAPAGVPVTVHLRPTETEIYCQSSASVQESIFVNETATCYVTVKDLETGNHPPTGTVNLATDAPSNFSIPASCALTTGTDESTCSFSYSRSALPEGETAFDILIATYVATNVHAGSDRGFALGVMRRKTNTSVSCTQMVSPSTCTVTVTEDPSNRGPAVGITGSVQAVANIPSGAAGAAGDILQNSVVCSLPACTFMVTPEILLTNVSVRYEGSTVHLKSIGSDNITAPTSSLPTASPGGSVGAIDVAAVIFGLNTGCLAADVTALVLEGIQIGTDLIPDTVVVALFAGTTIPVSDLIASIFGFAKVVLQTYVLAACTDLDGDGLPGVVELNATNTSDSDWDSDDDMMGDGDEIFNNFANGFYGGTPAVCPSPSDPDSDDDGLLDGPEDEDFGTEFCSSDSDQDGAGVTTVGAISSDFYEVMVVHTNPQDPDTDDDGLCDEDGTNVVTPPGSSPGLKGCPVHPVTGIARSEFGAGTNSFDPDTDGDEILDGDEDLDGDGVYGLADTTAGIPFAIAFGYYAEPDPTIFDTDMDDLGDGFELGSGSGCDPSDPDTDDDDLSDSEEVNDTHTTCSNPDSDGDGLGDADEHFVLSGVFPTRDLEQVTDPLIQDTDGDGRNDNLEYSGSQIGQTAGPGQPDSCVPGTLPADTGPGFANSFDSDDDGLNDGPDFLLGADVGDSSGNNGELSTDILDSICDPDSDDDGLLDGEEHEIGVDPLDWDDDDDGLGDQEELQTYFTDPNDTDTDDDNADGIIPARDPTAAPVLSGHSNAGTIVCLSDCEEAFSASMQGLFVGEIRDETDPLQKDTDGDGIQDDIEFAPGCNVGAGGTGTGIVLNDGYANSFDSDGDGAHDGVEAGVAGVLAGYPLATVGSDVAASSGNEGELNDDGITNICDPDSDGDGLLDGDEIGQTLDSATGALPLLGFLDWDSDDDGLSDLEETQIYFTDPELADTDGDLADGVIASRTPAFSDSAHPALTGHSGAGVIDCLSDCEEVFSGTLLFNPAFVAVPGSPPAPGAAAGFGNPLDETDPLQQDTDGDGINDNIEFAPGCNTTNTNSGSALFDGFANSFDSDADGLRDFEDAVADVFDAASITIDKTPVTRVWASYPETPRPLPGFAKDPSPDGQNDGELSDDAITGICDPDSDGDGVLDGEEHQIQSDIYDWDTDDDGREDSEFLGEGPIQTDPFDFDTDDDGLGDGVEVFGANTTNPVNADTDFDGLCDGGATTPASTQFGPAPGPGGIATGGVDGAGSNPLCYTGVAANPNDGASPNAINPTPSGWGEDVSGDGTLDASETDPNDFDTDDDAVGDGVELLAFYTSRQSQIPAADLFGRTINVVYPMQDTFVCMNPLNPDSDGDGLSDGVEDLSHDGIFDFEPGDFDHAGQGPIPGPAQDNPEETNPCDPDTDDDTLNDFLERNQPNLPPGSTTAPQSFYPFNPTNPLDHDTDNDYMLDGEEVFYICPAAPPVFNLDNDNDGSIDEDPLDGVDNDLDGKIDEDGPDFTLFHVDFLDPTNRDTDGDGWIDGLDPGGFGGPCNTEQMPVVGPGTIVNPITDSDNDGFADDDEIAAGTDPFDPNSHPTAFYSDLDLDLHSALPEEALVDTQGEDTGVDDDRLWLEDPNGDGVAESVAIDTDANVLVDVRVLIISPRDVELGDFDGDGAVDDRRYVVVYALANYRFVQPRVVLVIDDYDSDGVIDRLELSVQ